MNIEADFGGEVDKAQDESSTDTEDTADEEALLTHHDGPATDELARKMLENETRLLQRIARMKQKKKTTEGNVGSLRSERGGVCLTNRLTHGRGGEHRA